MYKIILLIYYGLERIFWKTVHLLTHNFINKYSDKRVKIKLI